MQKKVLKLALLDIMVQAIISASEPDLPLTDFAYLADKIFLFEVQPPHLIRNHLKLAVSVAPEKNKASAQNALF